MVGCEFKIKDANFFIYYLILFKITTNKVKLKKKEVEVNSNVKYNTEVDYFKVFIEAGKTLKQTY